MKFRIGQGVKARNFASVLQQEVLFQSARSLYFLLFHLPSTSVMSTLTQEDGADTITPVC